jgi:hypothetical protein
MTPAPATRRPQPLARGSLPAATLVTSGSDWPVSLRMMVITLLGVAGWVLLIGGALALAG